MKKLERVEWLICVHMTDCHTVIVIVIGLREKRKRSSDGCMFHLPTYLPTNMSEFVLFASSI